MLEGIWWSSYVAVWVLVVAEAVVIMALARQLAMLQARVAPAGARMANPGLEVGDEAPLFQEQDLNGLMVTLGTQQRKPTLLVFLSPRCPTCVTLAPALQTLYHHERKYLELVLISLHHDEKENQAYAREHRLDRLPFLRSSALADIYHVAAAPYAILVDAAGKIHTKGLVNNLEQLESLLNALDEGYSSYDNKMNALQASEAHSS